MFSKLFFFFRVCKAWSITTRDAQLWQSLKIQYIKSNLNKKLRRQIPSDLPAFLATHIGDSLTTCSYDNIPESVVTHLNQFCPNLKRLSITNYTGCYTTCSTSHRRINKGCVSPVDVDLSQFPSTIEELQLKIDVGSITSRSSIAFDTSDTFFMHFENLTADNFPDLKKLSLTDAKFGDEELVLISTFKKLTYFHLEGGTFSISDVYRCMSALLQNLVELTHLEVLVNPHCEFKYVDLANAIKENCKKLTYLKVCTPQFSFTSWEDFAPSLNILATIPSLKTLAICVEYNVGIFDILQNVSKDLTQNCRLILNVCRGYPTRTPTELLEHLKITRSDLEIIFLDIYWKEFAALSLKQHLEGLQLDC